MDWNGIYIIKVYKNTSTGATKHIDNQFFLCFLFFFTFSQTWYVLYELSHVVKIKMYNN